MSADGWIRGSATIVVAGVAGVAGWLSYSHAVDVVRLAGVTSAARFAYPATVDGTLYMASMVLLSAARRRQPAPALGWAALGTGVALTLAANIYAMSEHGVLGMFVGALPAVALVLSTELLMHLVRGTRRVQAKGARAPLEPAPQGARAPSAQAARLASPNGHDADVARFRPYIERGQAPPLRMIKTELGCGQVRAQEGQQRVRALLP